MKNIFDVIPENLFKPLAGKYRRIYADCILLIYENFKAEISYGVNREVVIRILTDYFETDDYEMTFDEVEYISDAREKANGIVQSLKSSGWIEYEQAENHMVNVTLYDYTIPIIESLIRVRREEETEYQGLISQIHASLQNEELYRKPYELIVIGVRENTERLVSELKRLHVSIKRYMDKQTKDMEAKEIMELFLDYHNEIGSKAYYRMKTADNISRFRGAIVEKLTEITATEEIMERTVKGFMEVEGEADTDVAYEKVLGILNDIKYAFYHLDDIIKEIDYKHTLYLKNALARARFILTSGNNAEGKLASILKQLVLKEDNEEKMTFSAYPMNYISPESLRTISVKRELSEIASVKEATVISEKERRLFKEALRERNRIRFSRKNINAFVGELLKDKDRIPVDEIEVKSRRDIIRIIYISIYSGNNSNIYRVKRSDKRIKVGEYEIPYFEIQKR